jgi:hypothetical protein
MNSRTLHDENEDMEGIEARDEDGNDLVESTEDEFGIVLYEALELYAKESGLPEPRICSFADAGYLTMNRGLVVRMGGATFELTIVRRS